MGSAKLRAFAGVNPVDGRLAADVWMPSSAPHAVFGVHHGWLRAHRGHQTAGARLSFGEPETGVPADLLAREVSVAPVGAGSCNRAADAAAGPVLAWITATAGPIPTPSSASTG